MEPLLKVDHNHLLESSIKVFMSVNGYHLQRYTIDSHMYNVRTQLVREISIEVFKIQNADLFGKLLQKTHSDVLLSKLSLNVNESQNSERYRQMKFEVRENSLTFTHYFVYRLSTKLRITSEGIGLLTFATKWISCDS